MGSNSISLKAKLLVLGIALTVIPLILVFIPTLFQGKTTSGIADDSISQLSRQDLLHVSQGVYTTLETQEEVLQQMVTRSLNVAESELKRSGGISLSPETVDWTIKNQLNPAESGNKVTLPKLMIGNAWAGVNNDANVPSPVVDNIRKMLDVTCTIFQRVDDRGNMLRVVTSILQTNGKRAIGTYIPVNNADGTPNPVVAALLAGKAFRGRAFVVDKWYIAAYSPLKDNNGKVIGAVYVGVPQESATALRGAIKAVSIGESGGIDIMDSKGISVISKDTALEGKEILNETDAEGKAYVKEIIDKATQLTEKASFEYDYKVKTPDGSIQTRYVDVMYFKPWDWIVVVGANENDFYKARNETAAALMKVAKKTMIAVLLIGLVSSFIAIIVWQIAAGKIAGSINTVVSDLVGSSSEIETNAYKVADSSQELAKGAADQASAIEEISASLEEMRSMTKQNAVNASQARELANDASHSAQKGNGAVREMIEAMKRISESSSQTSNIIKTIDEIAFQTNLLALNAAVEAARAGEAGKGFAVVAEEVRNLAQRSAEAARNTSDLIEGSVKNTDDGKTIADNMAIALDEIVHNSERVSSLIGEIAAASKEQATGIDQIGTAIQHNDNITQTNAANSEETASLADQMKSQALLLNEVVEKLKGIVGGR